MSLWGALGDPVVPSVPRSPLSPGSESLHPLGNSNTIASGASSSTLSSGNNSNDNSAGEGGDEVTAHKIKVSVQQKQKQPAQHVFRTTTHRFHAVFCLFNFQLHNRPRRTNPVIGIEHGTRTTQDAREKFGKRGRRHGQLRHFTKHHGQQLE